MTEPEPRAIVNARLSKDAIALIDAIAKDEYRTRSEMVRVLLKEAIDARAKAGRLPQAAPKRP